MRDLRQLELLQESEAGLKTLEFILSQMSPRERDDTIAALAKPKIDWLQGEVGRLERRAAG